MTSQILAQIENDNGLGNDRVVEATEDSDDQVNWTYEVSSTSLKMKWMDPTIVAGSCNCDDATDPAACTAAAAADADACELAEGNWITDSNDGTASCVVIDYGVAEDHELRGCTDPLASNYFGGDNNDFGITATKETGKCHYSVDEASQPCVKISHDDFDLDGEYTEDEVVTYNGIIDCAGACQYESLITGWIGDGICDGGTRGDAAFNCEAFDWDGWDCACAPSCLATYDKDTEVSASLSSDDVFNPSQIGEGNNGPGSGSYTNTNCQEACMVEDCGYDMLSTADDVPATYEFWDCCSEACLNSLIASDGSTCSDACNLGECNFYRKGGVSIGGCCDQSGPDGVFGDNANTASIDESVDDIDCSNYDATTNPDGLGADGKCDEECNSGACNNDGGDCE